MKESIYIICLFTLFGCSQTYDIAYVSDRDGNLDIYITDSDFQEVVNLTESTFTEYNLTWSKDGTKIYYTSYENSGRALNSIDINSGTREILLSDTTILSLSDVSSNGENLLISTTEHSPKGELYIFNTELKSKTRITNNDVYEAGAKYTKDEEYIVSSIQVQSGDSVNHSGIAEIFMINVATKVQSQLTELGGFSGLPQVSPDGSQLVFHLCKDQNCDIYILDIESKHLINLTKGKDDNRWPRWSPDGMWIAFTKTIDSNSDIYFVSPDGKKVKPIIETEFRDEIAIFKPFPNKK